jgi:hypothetical protein
MRGAKAFLNLLPQHEFLHFAGNRHGKRLDEIHVSRNLIVSYLNPAIRLDLLCICGESFPQSHDGTNFFTAFLVGDTHHRHIKDLRMAV